VVRLIRLPLYVLPVADGADEFDLVYFKSAVARDLAWLRTMHPELARQVASTSTGGGVPSAGPDSTARALLSHLQELEARSPWWLTSVDLAEWWTEYAGLHAELLGQLPASEWDAALTELACQDRKVLQKSRAPWVGLLREARASARAGHQHTPSLLQGLFNEIEFARQYTSLRIAKYLRLSAIVSLLIGTLSFAVAFLLSRQPAPAGEHPNIWLIVVLGLLGGAVSALRQNETLVGENRAGLRVADAQLRLRPLIGAMASIIVYVIAESGLILEVISGPQETGTALMQVRVGAGHVAMAYYVLSFLSGFSERFFLGMLDRVGERFEAGQGAPAPTGADADGVPTPGGDDSADSPKARKAERRVVAKGEAALPVPPEERREDSSERPQEPKE
jgi:hypothetical protein